MIQVFGESVRVTDLLDCRWNGDHRKLIADARVDCLNRGLLPDDRYALCGKCRMAVSLNI